MLAEVRQLRGDLTLVAMSATLDAPRFAALIGDARRWGGGEATAAARHRSSTVRPRCTRWTCEWAPAPAPRLDERGVARAFLDHVADTAAAGARGRAGRRTGLDALVFVPGRVGGVLRCRAAARPEAALRSWNSTARPRRRSRTAPSPGGNPAAAARIIVSTALAESSLTVPGVRLVIDSGLSREPRRDASRGMSGLVTVSCSRASAEQRAGRAARQGPGTVIRCYDQRAFGAAPAHPTPEIAAADLTGAALVLACWGAPGGRGLALPDAPPRAAMDEAVEVLRELGAVAPDGHATELGKILARVPTDPRLARALLDGAATVGHRTAAEAVALVSGDQRAPGADLTRLLAALRTGRDPGSRRWAEDVRRMEAIARQEALRRRAFPQRLRRWAPRRRSDSSSPWRSRTGWRAAFPATGPDRLPADLRDAGRAAGRQPPVRARVAGRGRSVPRAGARRRRDRRRHPLRGAADGGHRGGRRPALS